MLASDSSETPLRILHWVPAIRLEQGGVVRAILDWCTVFAERGHRMTLVTYNGQDVPRDWLTDTPGKPRAHVVPFPLPPAKQLQRRSMRLIDDLLRQTDVLHLHSPWLDGNRQIANLAVRRGVPYVVSLHGMLDDWAMDNSGWKKRLYMSLYGRRTLNNAARIHCTAEAELAQTQKWFDNPATVVLPYLVDLKPYENLPGPAAGLARLPAEQPMSGQDFLTTDSTEYTDKRDQAVGSISVPSVVSVVQSSQHRDSPRLLFLSRLSEQKGIDTLVRAAALMRDAGTRFVLLVAGTGFPAYEKMIRALVAELHLDDRVVFLGQVNGTEKFSLYQSADLFVLPTRHENFGLVLTEAMACGTPVLTTRGTDIWQEVQAAGGEISESTPQAIADAATQLLNDPQARTERGRRGRDWVFANLAVEPLTRKYEAMYREIAAIASPPG